MDFTKCSSSPVATVSVAFSSPPSTRTRLFPYVDPQRPSGRSAWPSVSVLRHSNSMKAMPLKRRGGGTVPKGDRSKAEYVFYPVPTANPPTELWVHSTPSRMSSTSLLEEHKKNRHPADAVDNFQNHTLLEHDSGFSAASSQKTTCLRAATPSQILPSSSLPSGITFCGSPLERQKPRACL